VSKKPPGGNGGCQSSPERARSQTELLGGCVVALIPVSIISPAEGCEAGKECSVLGDRDALQMWSGIFIVGGGASTQPSAASPCSAPFLARPQNFSSKQGEICFLFLPLLFDLLICSEPGRGRLSPCCWGGLGLAAGNFHFLGRL